MKILEIISPQISFNRSQERFQSNDRNGKRIGSGAYATVTQDDDPHMVNRTSRGNRETRLDAYWVYARYIMKYELWKNPYIPRFYAMNTKVYADDQKIKSAKIEKLQELSSISEDEGIFLYIKMFGENVSTFDREKFSNRIEKEVESLTMANRSDYDQHYVKAVKIIHQIAKKERFHIDIWHEDLMCRRGPHGIQLVITDPFISHGEVT